MVAMRSGMVARLALVCSLCLLLTACASAHAPVTGRSEYFLVSEESVEELARQSYAAEINRYATANRLNVDPAETAMVQRVASRIIAQAKTLRPESAAWNWEVNLLTDPEVNACCMAGGKIVVFTTLIRELSLSDDELAGVLAHEVSHALAQHIREDLSMRLTQDAMLNRIDKSLASWLYMDPRQAANANAVSQMAGALSKVMVELPHSREQEAEADRIGLTLMARAGYDPTGAVSAMQKMSAVGADDKTPAYLRTHPLDEQRIEAMRSAILSDPELAAAQSVLTLESGPTGKGPEEMHRLKAMADGGDAKSSLALGVMLINGSGVPADREAGAKWVVDAAERGDPEAMNAAGIVYARGLGVEPEFYRAAEWFQKAGDKGWTRAEYNLGNLYAGGQGLLRNLDKAMEAYLKAADAGYVPAQRAAGILYFSNQYKGRDEVKGVSYLRKAADAGDAMAQFQLGTACLTGKGTDRNVDEALMYLTKAADAGNGGAMNNLGVLYRKGDGVPRDPQKAAQYFGRAADLEIALAQRNLGLMYAAGEGVPQDLQKAFTLLKRAADHGDNVARLAVARMYHDAKGTTRNMSLAGLYTWLSAEGGLAEAQYAAGKALATGEYGRKDEKAAVNWFKRAAAQGHARAKEALLSRGIAI